MKVDIGNYPEDYSERPASIKIDPHDLWNLDGTLALIILPALKAFKKVNSGAPFVDDEDVPTKLRSTHKSSTKKRNDDMDSNFEKRWNYVLNKMIWAFSAICKDEKFFYKKDGGFNLEAHERHRKKIKKGLALFGKYYQALWV